MSEIFRKKSIERVNSPEELNEYMRVTNPSIWVILVCVILILSSAVFWGLTAKLETTKSAVAVNYENNIVCYIKAEDINDVKSGTIVRIDKSEYHIKEIGSKAISCEKALDNSEMSIAGFNKKDTVYEVKLEGKPLAKSTYADVVLEEVSLVSFLFGNGN